LSDLKNQNYPGPKYEVIIVDDDSLDNTREIVDAWISEGFSNLYLISSDKIKYNGYAPKKAALASGIDKAGFDFILQTDGDCRVGNNWLSSFNKKYAEDKPKLISGPVMYDAKDLSDKILQIELASLVGIGASTLNSDHPTMCNGANLFYEKNAFQACGAYGKYSAHSSGDDEFLMHNMFNKYPTGLTFLKSEESLVVTQSPQSLKTFIYQRVRWASKWNIHEGSRNMFLAVFIFIINLHILTIGLFAVFDLVEWQIFMYMMIIKVVAEYMFLQKVMADLGTRINLLLFIFSSILYPFYAVFFGILSNLIKPEWKNRKQE